MTLAEDTRWMRLRTEGALEGIAEIEANAAAELSICADVAYGTRPRPYGALITSVPPADTVGRLVRCTLDVEELRRVADGRSLLICRSASAPVRLLRLRTPLQTDADCEALVAKGSSVLVRADGRGSIRFVGPAATTYLDGRDTWTRPHMSGVLNALTRLAPAADTRTLKALLNLTYSQLCAAPVGATLVYQLTSFDDNTASFSGVPLEALRLNVNQTAHLGRILHQIEHRDGAVVFGRNGQLRRAGVILVPSPAALESLGAVRGGTRHHSAAWHSYDRPDVVCFVVSKAGRVTVFSRGDDVSPLPCRRASPSNGT